jgi:hypothetical protein
MPQLMCDKIDGNIFQRPQYNRAIAAVIIIMVTKLRELGCLGKSHKAAPAACPSATIFGIASAECKLDVVDARRSDKADYLP